jgi:hypothetical protein
MTRRARIGRLPRIAWLPLVMVALVPSPAAAQTADEFFDDGALHDVRLYLHTADWQQLQAHAFETCCGAVCGCATPASGRAAASAAATRASPASAWT